MRTFSIEYELIPLLTVEIDDEPSTMEKIKEMVDFWSNAEHRLQECDGDYVQAFLRNLASFALRLQDIPGMGEEGWYELASGEHGIKVTDFERWEHDEDSIEIKEK